MKTLVSLGVSLFGILVHGQIRIGDEKINQLTDYLELAEVSGFSGQVLVAQGEKVMLNMSLGYLSEYTQEDVNHETVFGIASISKQFTAAAIGKLVQEGMLDFKDSIGALLRCVPKDKQHITVHDLLTHRSGLTGMDIVGDYGEVDKSELLNLILQSDLEYPTGELWRYSNAGYNLLGFIIEAISETSYEEYLVRNFFLPLNMAHTGIIGGRLGKQEVKCALGMRGDSIMGSACDGRYNIRTFGGGSIYSNVDDLHKWNISLWNNSILKPSITHELFGKQVSISENESYGYGWFIYSTDWGGKILEHGGDTYIGYNGGLYNFVDTDISVIILNNRYENIGANLWTRWAIYYPIIDILFKEKSMEKVSVDNTKSPILPDAGIYRNGKGTIRIEKRGKRILATALNPKAASFLFPIADSIAPGAEVVARKTETLFQDIGQNPLEAYQVQLLGAAEDYATAYEGEWKAMVKDGGKLLEAELLAVVPNYHEDTISSYVKFIFENGARFMSYRYLDNGRGRLSGSTPNETYRFAKWFHPNGGSLIHYNLWNKEVIRIEVLGHDKFKIKNIIWIKDATNSFH